MNRQTKKLTIPAPRNPYVAAAKFRKAGTHLKSDKALRRAGKTADQRESGNRNRDGSDESLTLGWHWMIQSTDKSDCTFLSVF